MRVVSLIITFVFSYSAYSASWIIDKSTNKCRVSDFLAEDYVQVRSEVGETCKVWPDNSGFFIWVKCDGNNYMFSENSESCEEAKKVVGLNSEEVLPASTPTPSAGSKSFLSTQSSSNRSSSRRSSSYGSQRASSVIMPSSRRSRRGRQSYSRPLKKTVTIGDMKSHSKCLEVNRTRKMINKIRKKNGLGEMSYRKCR